MTNQAKSNQYSHIIKMTLLVLGALSTWACSNQTPNRSPELQKREQVFSDRPIGLTTEVLMVQLSTPALLETKMTPDDYQALATEQSQFEEKMRQISTQIQVLYRYRFTLNGFALVTPAHLIPQILQLLEVKQAEKVSPFARPEVKMKNTSTLNPLEQQGLSSVDFIGAQALYKAGITGQGVSVGVIDTGIDYTHKMLGGRGLPEDYKSIDPAQPTAFFPNEKVVGGIDLAGTRFSGHSEIYDEKIPRPDMNPLDEAGHGTHVAGTVAGDENEEHTYSGVAPDAKLYAIKVFGKKGSTFDAIVIAGFEYAMDPNGDLDTKDHLDVLNLSLGGGYGSKKILYNKAIENLAKSGVIVVAAAGNDGAVTSIVGAPSTAEEAISVAASVDDREVNWKFPTVRFDLPSGQPLIAEFAEGNITTPLKDISSLRGKLVDIGLAAQDLTEDQKNQLKGNVAFIQRGQVTFIEKLKRAHEAGAIGAVVYNNQDGAPIAMGADDESAKVNIPGVMVDKKTGEQILASLSQGETFVEFKNSDIVEKPELIDSIADFSSYGPRTDDYGFKPEVAAPGKKILSAAIGTGFEGALSDGTSMASPHVAGAVALLRQRYPQLSTKELKFILMNTAKKISSPQSKAVYPYSAQGAGRVQLEKAGFVDFVVSGAVSMGLVSVPNPRSTDYDLKIKNISTEVLNLKLNAQGDDFNFTYPQTLTLQPGQERIVPFQVHVKSGVWNNKQSTLELNGTLTLTSSHSKVEVPVMAFRSQKSDIISSGFEISDEQVGKSQDKNASLKFRNQGAFPGVVYPFNLIGLDEKKIIAPGEEWKSEACDLQSVGYRWINKMTTQGVQPFLQFAFQLYEPRNHLKHCDFSILVDGDKDGKIDQEIVGISDQSIQGFQGRDFFAAILDYKKAQGIRKDYEVAAVMGQTTQLDYRPAAIAVGDFHFFSDSGLSIFEVPANFIKTGKDSKFQAKLVSINNMGEAVESDDHLGSDSDWHTLSTNRFDLGYWGMSDVILGPAEEKTISFMKSQGKNDLILYSPSNPKSTEGQKL